MQIDCIGRCLVCGKFLIVSDLHCQLPGYIDEILFMKMGAIYKCGSNFDFNLNNDKLQHRIYLGTYFPRSFSESYQLFSELFRNEIISSSVERKATLNILDIGTGTGGNVLGMMHAIFERGIHSKSITIYTLDGNEMATKICGLIVDLFNKINKTSFVLQQENITFSAESLKCQISEYLQVKSIKFDFITSSKFIGEFYNAIMPNGFMLYRDLTESVSSYLKSDGIFLLLDVVAGSRDRSCDFKSRIMSNELSLYIKAQTSLLSYIYPLPCAIWSSICNNPKCYMETIYKVSHSRKQNDVSNVSIRIMAHKVFGDKIIHRYDFQKKYDISRNTFCEKGDVKFINPANE